MKEELKYKKMPRASFLLDSFGHSLGNAWISKKMGIQYLIFSRIDFEDKINRQDNQEMKINWQLPYFGENDGIFTDVYPGHYFEPFEADRHRYKSYELDLISKQFTYLAWQANSLDRQAANVASSFWAQRDFFKDDIHMKMLGKDFGWGGDQKDHFTYLNNFAKYVNEHMGLEITWSTIEEYQKEWYKYYNFEELPKKYNEFLPYRDFPGSSWSGVFVAKPHLKLLTHDLGRLFQKTKQGLALDLVRNQREAGRWQEVYKAFWDVAFEVGVLVHHDAITGTATDVCEEEYEERYRNATRAITESSSLAINDHLRSFKRDWKDANWQVLNHSEVYRTDRFVTYHNITKKDEVALVYYNAYDDLKGVLLQIPVAEGQKYELRDERENLIPVDLACYQNAYLLGLKARKQWTTSTKNCVAYFKADLNGYAYNYFSLRVVDESKKQPKEVCERGGCDVRGAAKWEELQKEDCSAKGCEFRVSDKWQVRAGSAASNGKLSLVNTETKKETELQLRIGQYNEVKYFFNHPGGGVYCLKFQNCDTPEYHEPVQSVFLQRGANVDRLEF